MKTVILLLSLVLTIFSVQAKEVPEQLAEWQDWVMYGEEFRTCPYFSNQKPGKKSQHVCAWPQTLTIEVNAQGAEFSITWEVLQDSWIPLPGETGTWPLAVTANNQAQVVIEKNHRPELYLTPGTYLIKGQFSWQSRPEKINLPTEIASISLFLDNQPVSFPVKQANALWFGETASTEQKDSNSLDMEVNRLIIDGHPMTMFLAIDLYVSGVARNERLGHVLGEHLQLIHVSGDLSAYVDSKGDLWAQLQPGNNELYISMNINGWPDELSYHADSEYWPEQEIWAYQDNKNIRITVAEGGSPINPEQAYSRWDQVPNFLISQGEVFSITEQKRGTLNQSEQLSLYRQMWLSFDGNNYRTKDQITGEKMDSWRLDAADGYDLLNASSQGETLLITASDDSKQGVELRTPTINLEVKGEFSQQKPTHINAWQANFDTVTTDLYMPYGYLALATQNVDSSRNVWIEQWRLWDIFVVMLLTALTFKVVGIKSAIAAFLAMLLGYQGAQIPLFAWANLLLALAAIQFLSQGKLFGLFKAYALFAVFILVVQLTPSLVSQARLMIYPQLEKTAFSSYAASSPAPVVSKAKELNQVYRQTYSADNAMVEDSDYYATEVEEQGKIMVTGSRIRRSDMLNKYQAGSILQAGKGTPEWQHNSIRLNWDGPITADQSYQLYLITPTMRVIWRLTLIVTAIFWLLTTLQKLKGFFIKIRPLSTALFFVLLFCGQVLHAQDFPSPDMLNELKQRLLKTTDCDPNCAALAQAQIKVENNNLQIQLSYHTAVAVMVPIPTSSDWQITEVQLDGKTLLARIQDNNKTWVSVPAGIHQLSITGVLANRTHVSINFPINPAYIATDIKNWQVAGIERGHLQNNTLQLIRTSNQSTTEQLQTTEYKPFVKVVRSITFDDQWRVYTEVIRESPQQGVINLKIPLINGERPTERLQTENNQALLSFAADQKEVSWHSLLERSEQLELSANQNNSYIERWEVISSPQWHVTLSGIPLVATAELDQDKDDYFMHVFMPRNNEKLHISVSRPQAIDGEVLSIESIHTVFTVGKRTTKAEATIQYRATQGGRFNVRLDSQADVKKVSFDGVDSNLINENGMVNVSYLPGKHNVLIEWHLNQTIDVLTHSPIIETDYDYSNLTQIIKLPRNRWVLWGTSQGVGPAFLYWGELVVFVVLAFFISRIRFSPLPAWQWLALACAFGTFSWFAFIAVAAWLLFIGWKKQFLGFDSHYKNILLQWFSLFFTGTAVMVLIAAVGFGLLSYPDMGIVGAGSSSSQLRWFADMGSGQLPDITVLSVHLWWYKLLILVWSIWISFALMNWLKSLFTSFNSNHWWPKKKAKNTRVNTDTQAEEQPSSPEAG